MENSLIKEGQIQPELLRFLKDRNPRYKLLRGIVDQTHPKPNSSSIKYGIYVASRASVPQRAEMWRSLRDAGWPIISSWIDESGEEQTESFSNLWQRIEKEIGQASALIVYIEKEDMPVKGALVEVGMAIMAGIPVWAVLPGIELDQRNYRPIGSWLAHPKVKIVNSLQEPLRLTTIENILDQWTLETAIYSDTASILNHPAYLVLSKGGREVVEAVLERIACGDYGVGYFDLLQTMVNLPPPIPEDSYGDLAHISCIWLEWGHRNGFIH